MGSKSEKGSSERRTITNRMADAGGGTIFSFGIPILDKKALGIIFFRFQC